VVLPGLDTDSNEESWLAVGETHPQYGLARLLRHLEVDRRDVAAWPTPDDMRPASLPARGRLMAEALRPAETTDAWRWLQAGEHPDWTPALAGVRRLDAPGPREEALAIALAMREVLEQPGGTAALVTPDRALARRVAQALQRWGVDVDDSAGRPLGDTPVGTFLRLLTNAAATPTPVSLLALLKHPLAAGGIAAAAFRRHARDLERAVLRGPRPPLDLDGLRAAVREADLKGRGTAIDRDRLVGLLDRLGSCVGPFLTAMRSGERRGLADWLRLHVAAAEALAGAAEEAGPDRLWRGDDGEVAASFVAELLQAGADSPVMAASDYAGLFAVLVSAPAVRPRHGLHPRLHILGLMEARLQQFDRMILGGLNEGSWPPQPDADPWLSRPMRRTLGLATPERRIGLTAHDFLMAAGAAELLLSRAQRVDGTPTVPSRWLLRLEAVLEASQAGPVKPATRLLTWSQALDRPAGVPQPWPAPEPRPPVAARPRRLSVTQVETWMRDPYGLYARHVLGLQALEPLDADPGAAERGQFIHAALDRFVRDYPDRLPPDAPARLRAIGLDCFGPMLDRPAVHAFWWPRFERIADWFLATEAERRERRRPLRTEVTGTLVLEGPAGPFVLTARADRIDLDRADGRLAIIDYKTGLPPSQAQVQAGFAPQLPLEAAIAAAGGFEGIEARPTGELAFWRLSGGEPAGEIKALKGDPGQLAEDARLGLLNLIRTFDDPDTPYRSQPRSGQAPAYSDYGHLARVAEWSVTGEADE
jgi:ATP-dependent helicase/nuclease subunit B